MDTEPCMVCCWFPCICKEEETPVDMFPDVYVHVFPAIPELLDPLDDRPIEFGRWSLEELENLGKDKN